MPLLQLATSPGLWFLLLLLTMVTLPIFIGAVVLISRVSGRNQEQKLEELEQRVEALEAERD